MEAEAGGSVGGRGGGISSVGPKKPIEARASDKTKSELSEIELDAATNGGNNNNNNNLRWQCENGIDKNKNNKKLK